MRLARIDLYRRGYLGHRRADPVILARGHQRTSLCTAERLSAVLLWIY